MSSSAGRFGDVSANNPYIRFSDTRHSGYVLMDLDRTHMVAQLRSIDMRRRDPRTRVPVMVEQDARAKGKPATMR